MSLQAVISLPAVAATDIAQTWNDLRAKREALKSFHQEFEISLTFKTIRQHDQSSKWSATVDGAAGRWREGSVSGAGDHVKIFDGKDCFEFEGEGDEYVRRKRSSKEETPQPGPYDAEHLDMTKAVERDRRSCGLTNVDHECVTIDIPVKPWIRIIGANRLLKVMNGTTRVVFDTGNGLLISSRTVQNIDDGRFGYQSDTAYMLKRMSYNSEADESLFRIPSGAMKEARELSRWNADKIKKQLARKTAPDLALTDMQGKTIKLSELKGRTVLLDFWATWCGPCRADGPSLDKLHQKYGGNNLTIIGVSVDEDRTVVQKFLGEHPHQYSIALTTENEIPEAYRIGVFPTYIVIDSEGNLASATEGDKGFSELRRLLKKAGLETD
ncbi:MAG: TlpA family protein disulfide reductase [Acidobacteriota bacterium]|nr:TlpA family protein disulfide reductase [Acidobacteriota bacterium]